MYGTSPPGLTARDFHPPAFINPRDVFPVRSRQRSKAGARSTSSKRPQSPQTVNSVLRSDSPFLLSCCGEDSSDKPAGCVNLGPVADAPSPDSCEGDCDKCEDCFDDHKECDEEQTLCVDNCDDCLDEHEQACGQHGQVCTETCEDCDFSCFDCVDWSEFEKDKDLGLSYSVPLLGQGAGLEFDIAKDTAALSVRASLTDSDPNMDGYASTTRQYVNAPPVSTKYDPFLERHGSVSVLYRF